LGNNEIYQICLKTGEEKRVEDFLSPQALWEKTYSKIKVYCKQNLLSEKYGTPLLY
jgi:sensor domain CHASE-containing protein